MKTQIVKYNNVKDIEKNDLLEIIEDQSYGEDCMTYYLTGKINIKYSYAQALLKELKVGEYFYINQNGIIICKKECKSINSPVFILICIDLGKYKIIETIRIQVKRSKGMNVKVTKNNTDWILCE